MYLAALGFIADESEGFGPVREIAVEALEVAEFSDTDVSEAGEVQVELAIGGGRFWLPEGVFSRLAADPTAMYRGVRRGEEYTLRLLGEIPEALDALARLPAPPVPARAEQAGALA